MKKYLVSKLNIDDSFVSICPFGVDLELFSPLRDKKINSTVNFGFLGQISERKGFEIFLRFFSR